ncbi:hypothetical protein [Lacinutrix jangbogonensis]|uniref:hypothetical protein n=1 Tax=Lacinutrix jangbogonensis TaxID=1469557 RepID=UPI00053D1731|nr:hypothetical protein [Lacinutrix jangbogonensis]
MKSNYLLPNKYKILGWLLFFPGIVLGLLFFLENVDDDTITLPMLSIFDDPILNSDPIRFFTIIETGVLSEIIAIIVGGLLIALSKEKIEDEFVDKLRTDSFVWAMITNYIILLLATIFIYNMTFFTVLVFNMFTPLIFFIIRFNFLKLKSNSDEE